MPKFSKEFLDEKLTSVAQQFDATQNQSKQVEQELLRHQGAHAVLTELKDTFFGGTDAK